MKIVRPRVLALTLLGLLAAIPAIAQQGKPDPNRQAAKTAEAILSTGAWADLFNGKDLAGWHGDTNGYVAESGMLVCKKGGKNLYTDKAYGDFAFQFEFKLEESSTLR